MYPNQEIVRLTIGNPYQSRIFIKSDFDELQDVVLEPGRNLIFQYVGVEGTKPYFNKMVYKDEIYIYVGLVDQHF